MRSLGLWGLNILPLKIYSKSPLGKIKLLQVDLISELEKNIQQKLLFLKENLKSLQPGIIAVSGGLDSRFLSALARAWQIDVWALIFSGVQFNPKEIEYAKDFISQLKMTYAVMEINCLDYPELARNEQSRCYLCKKRLFSKALSWAKEHKRPQVLEGSHASDRQSFRPGRLALDELDIHSPLARANLFKQEIRSAACLLGLAHPDQPARPCLLTRFAYRYGPNKQDFNRLAKLENSLQNLGFKEFRIRVSIQGIWNLQLAQEEKKVWEEQSDKVNELFKAQGLNNFQLIWTKQISGYFDQGTDDQKR